MKNEIEGCQIALKSQSDTKTGLGFIGKRLDDMINTQGNEFGLAFFTDDILYFSSVTSGNNASMFRSQRLSGDWLASVKPDFPDMPPGHFCNGSFSPDHKRFYFTICKDGTEWEGVSAACDIYLTQNSGTEWSAPVKMRDYIKMDGTTATHPYVVHIEGIEYVYFSTNRIGGKRWYGYLVYLSVFRYR